MRSILINLVTVLSWAATTWAAPPSPPPGSVRVSQSGSWTIAESENFRVSSLQRDLDLEQIARNCEAWRRRLVDAWQEPAVAACWSPRCEIVIHSTLAEYRRCLGPQAGSSVGCTSINVQQGRVSERRIDLRADAADWTTDALPHELTHVVLADRFGTRPLPLWADEGMGVLAESVSKQELRREAAAVIERKGDLITAAGLLYDASLPRAHKRDAFYYKSAELVQFLIDRRDAPTFLEFLDLAKARGYDRALREQYGINGVGELQRLWQSQPAATGFTLLTARPGG